MALFKLDAQLEKDTAFIENWQLSRVCLMNDRRFPWLVLVPRREGIHEIFDLDAADRKVLMDEICVAARAVSHIFKPDKVNIGALGNVVPQFHVHVVGRKKRDEAWPKPVWGHGTAEPYHAGTLDETVEMLRLKLDDFKNKSRRKE